MPILAKSRRLRKELTLLDVYAIATGTTLSGGFFLLPGLAAAEAGPAMVLSYLLAAVPMIPAMFCAVELATAMPRAGGVYYYLDRSLGPLVGTIGGVGTWLALVFKSAFALVGMSAYLKLFFADAPFLPVAAALAVCFGLLNLRGAKSSGRMQLLLVIGLLAILSWFITYGATRIELRNFDDFLGQGFSAALSTAGLVYMSYMGITKVASISEEVKNPERSLPLGVFLALATAVLVYGVGAYVMVGVVPAHELANDLTPVASVADRLGGRWAVFAVSIAALLAFSSVVNAGILSASRYPLAMSRDHILPRVFSSMGRTNVPSVAIAVTVALILVVLLSLDVMKIAKLTSAFQLFVFALLAVAVIVMRESRIDSYDPGFRSPAYPWLHIFGIVAPLWLITQMGWLAMLFTAALIGVGTGWYMWYARERMARQGAIYHVFEHLGRHRFDGLDRELRSILKEKGLRDEDPFDEIVARSDVVDLDAEITFEDIVGRAATLLARRLPSSVEHLAEGFLKGTRLGATPVARGVALPHLRLRGIAAPEMVLVRCKEGVQIDTGDVFGDTHSSDVIWAVFFLVSPEGDPGQHLRILAELAEKVDDDGFLAAWMGAADKPELTEILLRNERSLSVTVRPATNTAALAGRALRELSFPEGCLVAVIQRDGDTIVPRGGTVLRDDDRLTIIGSREGIEQLRRRYGGGGEPART